VRHYLEEHHFPSFEVATAAQAAARARRQVAAGADGVKIFTGAIVGGDIGVLPMRLDIARAVVREAHRAGKPAFAHPSNAQGVELALASGVDVLAHVAPIMGPWSPQLVARLRAHKMALVPTLTLFEVEEKKGNAPAEEARRVAAVASQQLGAFAKAGGPVLFGTDVGYIDVFDTTREFELMSRELDWRAILASLTTNPAQRFAGESGTLSAGAPADLVVLDDDPAKDPTAFARVRYTVRAGRFIYMRPRAAAECRSHRRCD
jgi:imidazolonepropionase-like amidohydrolase